MSLAPWQLSSGGNHTTLSMRGGVSEEVLTALGVPLAFPLNPGITAHTPI